MKKMIVDGLETFSMLFVGLFLLLGLIAGAQKGIMGMLVGVVVAFILCIPVFGMLFLFLEMNASLRIIAQNSAKANSGSGSQSSQP